MTQEQKDFFDNTTKKQFDELLKEAVIQAETEILRKEVRFFINIYQQQLSDYTED